MLRGGFVLARRQQHFGYALPDGIIGNSSPALPPAIRTARTLTSIISWMAPSRSPGLMRRMPTAAEGFRQLDEIRQRFRIGVRQRCVQHCWPLPHHSHVRL